MSRDLQDLDDQNNRTDTLARLAVLPDAAFTQQVRLIRKQRPRWSLSASFDEWLQAEINIRLALKQLDGPVA